MRSVPGTLLVFVLTVLLVVTTPIGTGDSVHQDEILHPVLPHLHMIDGHVVSHAEADAAAAAAASLSVAPRGTAGPALGAGTGSEATGLGLAIYPSLPVPALVLPENTVRRTSGWGALSPNEFLDAPPDPPPNSAG